ALSFRKAVRADGLHEFLDAVLAQLGCCHAFRVHSMSIGGGGGQWSVRGIEWIDLEERQMLRILNLLLSGSLLAILVSCGGSPLPAADPALDGAELLPAPGPQQDSSLSDERPQDRQQPWESSRSAAGMDAGSQFVAGRDWFSSSMGVSENGEAARLSAAPGTN